MNTKLYFGSALLAGSVILFCGFSHQEKYPYQNASLPVETRVKDLVGRMTLEEKIKQLDMYWGREVTDMPGHEATIFSEQKAAGVLGKTGIGSIHDLYPISAEISNDIQRYAIEKTRLGIPVLFIEEGLHGYEGKGSTSFPIPLQLSGAFDTALVHRVGRVVGTETRAHGVDFILGPILDLARDPRWGRVEETYGEDPYLNSANGVAMVKGLQGHSLSDHDAVVAEPKHFSVHGIPEAGSNTGPANIGEREARSSYLYVFEKAVKEAHAMGIMAAYSEIDGIPCVVNHWLLTDVLRKEWGFNGMVVSDLGAIKMALTDHRIATDTTDVLSQALNAGLNMQFYDFAHQNFLAALTQAVRSGKISMARLNQTVSDVLRVKFMLGLFDHPYIDTTLLSKNFHSQAHQDLSLRAAQESICLLKNDNHVLPLHENQPIAVIGRLAESTYLGGYSNKQDKGISILDGLKARAGNSVQINYAPGYGTGGSGNLEEQAVKLARESSVAVVVLGEDIDKVGEGKDRANLDLDERQLKLIQAIQQTGKPVVAVLFNGRPLTIDWVAEHVPAIVETWFSGEKGGLAIADVLLGRINPSGKLPISFPRSVGQVPFYYNHKPTSHHRYVDEKNSLLFPFAHGLSYTTFAYSDLKILRPSIPLKGDEELSVKITNTGSVKGTEVVQLYLKDNVSSVTLPVLTLKGFQRIALNPGESGTVHFRIANKEMALWNRQMKQVVEPGDFTVMVGSSSQDIRLSDNFRVNE